MGIKPLTELTVVRKKLVQPLVSEPYIENKEGHLVARHKKGILKFDASANRNLQIE